MAVVHVGRLHVVVHIKLQEHLGCTQDCEVRPPHMPSNRRAAYLLHWHGFQTDRWQVSSCQSIRTFCLSVGALQLCVRAQQPCWLLGMAAVGCMIVKPRRTRSASSCGTWSCRQLHGRPAACQSLAHDRAPARRVRLSLLHGSEAAAPVCSAPSIPCIVGPSRGTCCIVELVL